MKKYTNRIKLMPKFTKCMSLAMILTFTSYEEAFAEMSYAEQTSFTVSMENQTLKSVINWVEKNSQFIFIYRTDIDLSRRVNVDVRNKTIEEVLKQMFAGTDLEYHIRDRQVIIRKAISREETPPIVMQQEKVTVKGIVTDAKGEAIIGANIIEKGTTNGTRWGASSTGNVGIGCCHYFYCVEGNTLSIYSQSGEKMRFTGCCGECMAS